MSILSIIHWQLIIMKAKMAAKEQRWVTIHTWYVCKQKLSRFPFSPEMPDTQAKKVLVITTRDCYILSGSFTLHMSQISAVMWNWACSLSLWTKSYHNHIERQYPFDISFKMHHLFSRVNFMTLSLIFSPDGFEGRRQMYT